MKENPNASLIIVFAKNPVLGRVKTRLAQDIGDEKALAIYHQLLAHTHDVLNNLKGIEKSVHYSDYLEHNDLWEQGDYSKQIQNGADLGARMSKAFQKGFEDGYRKICIIGTDCFEINGSIIQQAFDALDTHDFTLGPAHDGGYYLLGMNSMTEELFENKVYSTGSVADEAIAEIKQLNKSIHLLPRLHDVDYVDDLDKMNQ